jgi:pimeloyl-ACP methyl ester carboxylesterase
MPVLYLRGAADRLVPAWNGGELAKFQPHAELQTLLAAHLVLQTMPREAANCISQFVTRVAGEEPELIA